MDKDSAIWVIGLRRLARGPVRLRGTLPAAAEFWAAEDLRLGAAPRLEAAAEAEGRGAVRVRGTLQAPLALECRRCLRPLATELRVRLDLRFQPGLRPGERDEGVFGLEPDAAELDLREALREELLLALPEYPVCRETCAGLCPRCGRDRNEGSCGCGADAPDPRWDGLRRLFPPDRGV